MQTKREWTTIREYEDILLNTITELPVSPSTANATAMRLPRPLPLK